MAIPTRSISITQLGLTNDEIALLRHHQQAAASASGGSSSLAASHASSQNLLLLDGPSLIALSQHFNRLMQQIQARLEYLSEQSQMTAQKQYDRMGNAIPVADAEIARFEDILRQIDELEADFDRIRHIRDIVRGYRQTVEDMESELVLNRSSHRHPRGRHHLHSMSNEGVEKNRLGAMDHENKLTQKAPDLRPSKVVKKEEKMTKGQSYGGLKLSMIEDKKDIFDQGTMDTKVPRPVAPALNYMSSFSDSGDATMGLSKGLSKEEGGSETQTVGTNNQEYGVVHEVEERLASIFSSEIIQHLRVILKGRDNQRAILKMLPHLLEEFSIRLEFGAEPGLQKDIFIFVRHHRK
jgi:hypothetical protein